MAFGFFKKKEMNLVAPLNGKIVPLEEVPDPVFSQKMMGEGIAIQPSGGHIHAPFSGEIIMITPTKHAIAIRSKSGVEVLIHIGLETVALKGEGFKLAVKEGEQVEVGQLLVEVDWAFLKEHAENTITPIIVTTSDKEITYGSKGTCIQGETVLMTI
ncbi:PTS sugar transporter subunit IIA [Pradoshia sp.]